MIKDEAAIAEYLGAGATGRSPNSLLMGESTPVAPVTEPTVFTREQRQAFTMQMLAQLDLLRYWFAEAA